MRQIHCSVCLLLFCLPLFVACSRQGAPGTPQKTTIWELKSSLKYDALCLLNALVYDPFLGSGTTLAAAELTERVCYGIELDPKYVDVVVERWQMLSGNTATLDGDGRTFADIRLERAGVPA